MAVGTTGGDARTSARKMARDRYTGEYDERDEWSVLSSVAREGGWLLNECVALGLSASVFADSRAGFAWETLAAHFIADRPRSEDALTRSFNDALETGRMQAAKAEAQRGKPGRQDPEPVATPRHYLNQTGEALVGLLLWTAEYRIDSDTALFLTSRLVSRWRFAQARKEIERLHQDAATWTDTPDEFINHAQGRMLALSTSAESGSGVKNVADLLPGYLSSEYEEYQANNKPRGLKTGLDKLDGLSRGLHPGQVVIIAAGSGVGKTSLAINIAAHVAKTQGRVLIFSLEMQWQEIVSRLVWLSSMVDSGRYWRREMTEEDWGTISASTAAMGAHNLDIVDDASITLPRLQAVCTREHFRKPLSLVVVDYAQLITTGARSDNREQEVRQVSQGMKRLASALGVPVIVISQTNDDGKLRESRTLYHDASHVWILKVAACQDGIDAEKHVKRYELEVAKGRNSASGKTIAMLYHTEQTRLIEETYGIDGEM